MDSARRAEVERLLRAQQGVVGRWQLLELGLSPSAVHRAAQRWTPVHCGVWVSGHAALSPAQRWWAGSLTHPGTAVSHASAAAIGGFFNDPPGFVVVTRDGVGGRERCAGLLVCHSRFLAGDISTGGGLPPRTSAPRSLLDLVGVLKSENVRKRAVRDALRVGAVDAVSLEAVCRRHKGRRGVARLRSYAAEYAALPTTRTRSDAEILALAALDGAGLPTPNVNVEIAGFESDLSWPDAKLVVELDGASFHMFRSEDEKRDRAWRAAGWTVHRLPTDVVYEDPNQLLTLVRSALPPAEQGERPG